MSIELSLYKVLGNALINKGATLEVNLDTNEVTEYLGKGYAVSPYKALEETLRADASLTEMIVRVSGFIKKNQGTLKYPNTKLGLWVDQGKLYLDISVVTESKDEANSIALLSNQLAIYNLDTKETIGVNTKV